MSLSPGSRLGPFEVVAAIGAGGMGEVYRARDTRLQRDVAIKVLPAALAADQDRLARFEREARTLASLNHPHIAQLHGLELVEGSGPALVMELVDGEDLAERLSRGPVPVEETLVIGRQIADALDGAHALGIVHRDLKPANVKLRADGVVKVLDFGLAKALDPAALPDASLANSPTITSPAAMTMMGVILGTAAYMSPEQARGRPVDKRADIWAFGCVLYEMLTGRPAFEGETVTDVLGAIVKTDPDWTRLPAGTPPRIIRLLQHCLRKDQARRLRDIGDAIAQLDAADDAPGPDAAARPPASRARMTAIWAASIALAGIAAGAMGWAARRPEAAPVLKYHVALQTDGGVIHEPAISPDGRRVVYVGGARLWVQELGEWEARELGGTEAPSRPFWSPDGAWIAYFRSEALLKVPAAGGPVVRVATLPAAQGRFGSNSGAWAPDGTITISMGSGPLLRVPGTGGTPVALDLREEGLIGFRDLEMLPGGVLGGVQKQDGIEGLAVLRDGRLVPVLTMDGVRHASYSPTGHLVFQRMAPDPSIWAIRFSVESLKTEGEPFVLGPGSEPSTGAATLAFQGSTVSLLRQLASFTMEGAIAKRIGEPREWNEGVALSPDGRRILASATDGIWLYDVSTGARSRVTTGTDDVSPAWLPNDMMLFVRYESAAILMIKPASSLGGERALARHARFPRVTADGRRVVFNTREPGRAMWEVAWLDLDRPDVVHKLDAAHAGARFPSVSPDGKLVAYISGEMGHDEVFVTRLPGGEGKWQVSTDGGGWTYFSPKGDGVVYRALDGGFMFVPVAQNGTDVRVGAARRLFDWGGGWAPFYDMTRDGRGGITAVPVGRSVAVGSLSIIQNWHREFRE